MEGVALQAGVLSVLLLAFGDGARVSWLWLPAAALWLLALQYARRLSRDVREATTDGEPTPSST